jgi:hypothetical protein
VIEQFPQYMAMMLKIRYGQDWGMTWRAAI